VNLLNEPDTPTVPENPTVGHCVCGKPIWDPVSLYYEMGPDCRKKHGIVHRRTRVRLARTRPGGDCDGQEDLTDLLETPDGE